MSYSQAANCYSPGILAHITQVVFSYQDCTGGCYCPCYLFIFQVWKLRHKQKKQIAQVSHQDNNGERPRNPKSSFSEPAIMITLFRHLIHHNLNTALINLLFPKESYKPADITSCFFLEKSFLLLFLIFLKIHEVLWRNCLETYRIIIPIDIIQIDIFLCLCICLPY